MTTGIVLITEKMILVCGYKAMHEENGFLNIYFVRQAGGGTKKVINQGWGVGVGEVS